MQTLDKLDGIVIPINRSNVDTDAIIPKQFLKSIKRSGFGPNLFDEWRYLDQGQPGEDCSNRPVNTDFVLNQQRYQGAEILLARENFGCGSSREHAPWALLDYGIRVLLAPSFADIFFNNCFKNGVLPIVLADKIIDSLFLDVDANEGYRLALDLSGQTLIKPDGKRIEFEIDPYRKHCLINGLDDIGITLQYADEIHDFEQGRIRSAPWNFKTI